MRLRGIVAIAIAAFALAIEMWAVVPAPTLPLLALAVAVPELATWGVVFVVVATIVALVLARGRMLGVALVLAICAFGCAVWPLLVLATTVERAETSFADADIAKRTKAAPYSLVRSFVAAPAARGIRITNAIPFRTRDGATLSFDLYRPAAGGPHPTIVDIHGGGWVFGSSGAEAPLGRAFAAHGYTVIAPNYRLAPHERFPVQLHDIDDAIFAIARDHLALGVDTTRMAILGRSAGAELALLAAYEPQPVTVRATIGYYSPIDLIAGYRQLPTFDPADVRSLLRAYIGGTPDRFEQAYRSASPVDQIPGNAPATLLIGGDRDQLVRIEFQREMHAALVAGHVRSIALEFPWSNHAFDMVPGGIGEQLARHYTLRFLDGTIGAP